MKKTIIGVMGPGETATSVDLENAYQLGQLIAQQGWVLLTGGRNVGVMEAACQGAKSAQGLTLGILPGATSSGMSEAVDIAIFTNLGNARNAINVLSSDVVIACGMGAGTASEIALAIKENKNVILLNQYPESQVFFQNLSRRQVDRVDTPQEAIQIVMHYLSEQPVYRDDSH
ncbi:MAG: TIGR00725 family protein [Limnoraphis robusta]